MKRPTRASLAGNAYLDLQNRARKERRGTQELLTLYVVERWLARLSGSAHASKFVIKGGMLLAAYDARRPTADLDALARSIDDDQDTVVSLVSEIADIPLDDGVDFRTDTATSRIIREQALYSGVRIAMDTSISTAIVKFRIDVNFGDPITPAPGWVTGRADAAGGGEFLAGGFQGGGEAGPVGVGAGPYFNSGDHGHAQELVLE
jgi:hypothetical protein